MKYVFAVSAFLISFSCSPSYPSRPVAGAISRQCLSPTVVYCDPSLDPAACEAVEAAVTWWASRAAWHALLTFGGTRTAPDKVPELNEVYVGAVRPLRHFELGASMEAARTQFHAFRDTMCRRDALIAQFIATEDLTPEALEIMMAHELGHVLGLPHVMQEGCLMAPAHVPDAMAMIPALCESERNLLRALYGD